MNRVHRFIEELNRRNVFRAGAAYIVIAWLTVQVADLLLDTFAAPDWVMRLVVLALALGFPIALVLSWVFEITVSGVVRTSEVSQELSITKLTGRKIDFVIIGVLSVAVALFALDRFFWQPSAEEATASYDHSVAVLPFDLASEEIAPYYEQLSNDISRLLERSAQIRQAAADAIDALPANDSAANIAARLGVRYLINGTIEVADNGITLSVTVYDDKPKQNLSTKKYEEAQLPQTISNVAQDLLAQIGDEPLLQLPSSADPRAYEVYLRARQYLASHASFEEVRQLFNEALAIEPRSPQILGGYCDFLVTSYIRTQFMSDFEEAEKQCHRAWTIDSEAIETQRALGRLYLTSGQFDKARESLAAALAINPSDLLARVSLAETYHQDQPRLAESQLRQIIEQHPGSPSAYASLASLYFQQGRYSDAVEPQQWAHRLSPNDVNETFFLSSLLVLCGRFSEAKELLIPINKSDASKTGHLADVESNLATIYFFEGDYAGAAELYEKAVSREPEDSMYYRNLGDAVFHLEGKEAAEPIFRKAVEFSLRQLEINPNHYYAAETLMVASASIGDELGYRQAKKRVIEIHDTDGQSHYDMAVAASRLGDYVVSRRHAARALELGFPKALLQADPDIAASGVSFE